MTEKQVLLAVLFSSATAVLAAWLPPARWQPRLIAAVGAALLLLLSPLSACLLGVGAGLSYLLHRRAGNSRAALVMAVVVITATLISFMLAAAPAAKGIGGHVVLPFGLAFYALRLIHYQFEGYKGNLRGHSFDEYLGYLFMPSLLSTGPIHRFDEYLRDLRRKRWDPALFSAGCARVLYGLVKIVVLGNYVLAEVLPAQFEALAGAGIGHFYSDALQFWLKLYILFSGYSDVAVGFAALAGFRVRENFDRPFVARNISDFWQRWHRSLSSWCRDYVFTPVLSLTRSQGAAVVSSMVVLGLWHELSLRYVLWGAYHGAGIVIFRAFDARYGASFDALTGVTAALWRTLATALTLHFVLFSFYVTTAVQHWLTGG
jgi:D-alanyl-lipoteichoic acid acyltransferase DltB (MBOAT superfamily)